VREGFEPSKIKISRFTVCPRWPLEYLTTAVSGLTLINVMHSDFIQWCRHEDLNPGPIDYKSIALAN
jgi:hypothetical protein